MAKAADIGGDGAPFAKFTDLGDTLVGAFGSSPRACQRQARNYDTGEPLFKDDGKPQLEEIMWFVAMPGTTAKTGTADAGFDQIEEGAEVRFSVKGWKWGQVIEARKALPAYAGFKAGMACSGDVYEITLCGWSAETKNPAAAANAGFTVKDGRILLRSEGERERYVLAQLKSGGNTNPAKDFTVTIRRPTADEKRWEQAADELFERKPWEREAAPAAEGRPARVDPVYGDEEPF